mmetsp:Transcript_98433/g.228267  ORF Transcript_98433/g.228267 Transcript_98433/m.228267 type:complete len:81 (-) Transcript_98433:47-289(-)
MENVAQRLQAKFSKVLLGKRRREDGGGAPEEQLQLTPPKKSPPVTPKDKTAGLEMLKKHAAAGALAKSLRAQALRGGKVQ